MKHYLKVVWAELKECQTEEELNDWINGEYAWVFDIEQPELIERVQGWITPEYKLFKRRRRQLRWKRGWEIFKKMSWL